MTRLFLAAGVAALAISAPAAARPGDHGGKDRQTVERHSGAQRAQTDDRRAARQTARQERRAAPQQMDRTQRVARAERPQRVERAEQRQRIERPARTERAQARDVQRREARAKRVDQTRFQERRQARVERVNRDTRVADRRELRADRQAAVRERIADRGLRNERLAGTNQGVGYGVGGCPPGLAGKGCVPPGQAGRGLLATNKALRADRIVNADAFRASRLARLTSFDRRDRVFAPAQVVRFVGQPLSTVTPLMTLSALPGSVSYLYPDTSDYYYRYGGGYLYQVDRDTSLIAALLPLLTGGYMPGSYLPSSYMNSYVPSYWGMDSFYPASYSGYDYGYGYDNLCNRYANGVVYRVDCYTGMIVDAVPTYAGGYGVGQMLPSAYSTYNVPYQYRSLYYNTPDYNYWYAPGAIYQYDPGSSLITSVAALMSPGFTVGQQLPMGYSTYNVPYAYRSTYYDTPNALYRYNNGYIYQVDPTTQLVSAIVASILT
jgi:hypothetical protein